VFTDGSELFDLASAKAGSVSLTTASSFPLGLNASETGESPRMASWSPLRQS
jgi:hypothetical protein